MKVFTPIIFPKLVKPVIERIKPFITSITGVATLWGDSNLVWDSSDSYWSALLTSSERPIIGEIKLKIPAIK